MTSYIDTHCHLDGEEFDADRDDVVTRARDVGCRAVFLPAIDRATCQKVLETCSRYSGYCFPMLGLHPEEVRADWREQLAAIAQCMDDAMNAATSSPLLRPIAVGEVGLDYYWSRDYEAEQQQAFEEQVRWAADMRLPLMIHCRKAQNEMLIILKRYARELTGGVFHCFTGNVQEARQLLEFDRFVLGIGGVLTFKKSHLPETLAEAVPLSRIVLETDAPYMAPVPMRGKRNEPAYIRHVIARLAEVYGVSEEEVCRQTSDNAARVFGRSA